MSLLNFSNSEEKAPRNNKNLKLILGIGALAGVIALGSTLAASINLNSSDPVEFGQGVAQTVACSGNDSIIVTPTSKFINADGAGGFYFTSVTLSSIPSNCIGVDFTIAAYDSSGSIIRLASEDCSVIGTKPIINFQGSSETDHTTGSDIEMHTIVSGKSSTAFTVSWIGGLNDCQAVALAANVYRVTIESSGVAQSANLTAWSEITWTGTDLAGPSVYADGLMSGKPAWIEEVNATFNNLTFGFTSNGMHISGDAGNPIDETQDQFPYITTFAITEAQKVSIQFNFYQNSSCSDHGVMLFNSGTDPYWAWGEGSSGLIGQWDCGMPEIGGITTSVGGSYPGAPGILTVGESYIGIFTYDPTLSSDNLTLVTKELDGTIIDTTSLTSVLPSGDYKIGFSADPDEEAGSNSYFKNLVITIG